MFVGDLGVKLRIWSIENRFRCVMVAVYEAAQLELKPTFMFEIVRTCHPKHLLMMMGGDFNII